MSPVPARSAYTQAAQSLVLAQVSNALLAQAHSFNPPLLVAGGSLLLAALGCLL